MVALKPREADRFLASPPTGVRLFLVYGNDAGAITERARLIERVALTRGGSDAVLRFGSETISSEPGRVAEEAYSASLFGGDPVISLRVQDGRHNVLGAIEAVLRSPPEAAWLVVEAGELSRTSALLGAFEAARHAAAVPCYQADASDLGSFVTAAAEGAELVVEPDALELLLETLGGDRMASRRELEKLFLYVGLEGRVTRAHVEAIIGDTVELRSDDVIDSALLGNNEAVESGLERLRAEGGSPSGLATQALRHLIMLQGLQGAVDSGGSASAVLERARPPVFARRRGAVQAALQLWPSTSIRAARARVAEAISLSRRRPALETAAVSAALHETALQARRLRRERP
jgi:DNA polymerase-3 subunit delta